MLTHNQPTDEPRRQRLPWFRFWVQDWLTDEKVSLMTMEQRGIYLELLLRQWVEGSVPSNPHRVCQLLGLPEQCLSSAQTVLEQCFSSAQGLDDRLRNERLERERTEIDRERTMRSDKARKAASARYRPARDKREPAQAVLKHYSSSAQAVLEHASQSQSQSQSEEIPPLPPKGGRVRSTSDPPGFTEFWSAWPVKRGRTPAVKAFRQLGAADQAVATQRLRDYLARRAATEQAGGWVPSLPNPATWLNQARWQDEFPIQPRASPTEGRTNSQPGGWGDWANGKYPTLAELRAFQSRGGPGVISTREDLIARHGADAVARWDAMDATPEDPPEKSDDSTRNYLARRAAEEPVTREGMIAKYGAGDGHARWDAIQNAVQNAMAGDPSEEPSDSTRSN